MATVWLCQTHCGRRFIIYGKIIQARVELFKHCHVLCIMMTLVKEEKLGKELVISLWMWKHGKELESRSSSCSVSNEENMLQLQGVVPAAG